MRAILGVLLAANLAAAVIAFKPVGGSADDLRRERGSLQQQLINLQGQVAKSKKLAGMLGNRVDDATIMVHPSERGRLKQALLKLGWPAEDLAGYVNGEAHEISLVEQGWTLRSYQREAVDSFWAGGSGVVVLGSVSDGKVALIVGVTKDLTSRVQAGKIIAEVAKKVGGSGGGRPDMAEAGGKDPSALDSALNESYDVIEKLLN